MTYQQTFCRTRWSMSISLGHQLDSLDLDMHSVAINPKFPSLDCASKGSIRWCLTWLTGTYSGYISTLGCVFLATCLALRSHPESSLLVSIRESVSLGMSDHLGISRFDVMVAPPIFDLYTIPASVNRPLWGLDQRQENVSTMPEKRRCLPVRGRTHKSQGLGSRNCQHRTWQT